MSKNQSSNEKGVSLKTENIPYILLSITVFLMPVIFLPQSVASISSVKMFIVHIFVLISFFVWLLVKIKEEKTKLPFNLLSLSLLLIPFVSIVSAFFSKNVYISLFGRDFAIDSVLSLLTFFVLLILLIANIKHKAQVVYLYGALFISFIIIGLIQLLNFIPSFPSFGYWFDNTVNTVGKWNEMAIFSLIITILSIITLHFLKLAKRPKTIVNVALYLSLVLLIIINFKIVWYILGIFSLFLLVYFIVADKGEKKGPKIPFLSLIIFLISFFFIVSGPNIGNTISNILKINHFEMRPSWGSTFQIVGDTWSNKRAILGVGPALFETEWIANRPSKILETDFWNLDFRYGVGLIPSYFSTTGIIGGLSWLFFFSLFMFYGFKAIFRKSQDMIEKYVIFSSFSVSMILWVVNITYLPSTTLVFMTFVFSGVFIASLYRNDLIKYKEIQIKEDQKFNFLYLMVIIILLVGTIGLIYKSANKFVGHLYFQKAIVDLNVKGDIEKAEINLNKAVEMEKTDTYFRSLAELGTLHITQILQDNVTPQDLLFEKFRNVLSLTISNYQSAINFDETNYNNYLGLAELYRSIGSLNVEGAYDQANNYYNKVVELKPNNPDILLRLARLEFERGNSEKARSLISSVLQLKPNYVDAIFLYSQVEVKKGNVAAAIEAVEVASVIRPNDPTVFFQLGLLYYNNNQFQKAASAFERALSLNPDFQNAKYFLGLSYQKIGKNSEAIDQFEDLLRLNIDNREVSLILSNLKAGKAPFTDAKPPIDDKPENREELPLVDGESKEEQGQD